MTLCTERCSQNETNRENLLLGLEKMSSTSCHERTLVGLLGASSEELSGSNRRCTWLFPHSSQIFWIPSSHYLASLLLYLALKTDVSLAMVCSKQPLLLPCRKPRSILLCPRSVQKTGLFPPLPLELGVLICYNLITSADQTVGSHGKFPGISVGGPGDALVSM